MTKKINGFAASGQFLTGGLNFYTVTTTVDIRPDATKGTDGQGVDADGYYEATVAQKHLDKLIEAISLRAQPIILNAVKTTEATADDADLINVAEGATVYKMSFAIEHNMAWEVQGSSNPTLSETLDGVLTFVHKLSPTTGNNVAVVAADFL